MHSVAPRNTSLLPGQKVSKVKKLLWIFPGDVTILLLLLGPALANLRLIAPLHGFLVFVGSAVTGIVAIILGLWPIRQRSVFLGTFNVAAGLLPLAIMMYFVIKAHSYPRINDISTDLDNPPALVSAQTAPDNQGKDLGYSEEFKDIVREAYPALISLQMAKAAADVFTVVEATARQEPTFKIVRSDPATLTLEGESTTGLFHFVDDFVIRVQQLEEGSQVDMRSRSRVGKGDFGANAKRIAAFFAKIKGSAVEEQALLNEMPGEP